MGYGPGDAERKRADANGRVRRGLGEYILEHNRFKQDKGKVKALDEYWLCLVIYGLDREMLERERANANGRVRRGFGEFQSQARC